MFCQNCKNDMEDDSNFCDECGFELSKKESEPITKQSNITTNSRRTKKKYYIFSMFFIIFMVNALIYFLGSTFPSNLNIADILSGLARIAFILITIWFSRVVEFNIFITILLGISTLLPFMVWISMIVLLKKYCKLENLKLTFFLGDKEITK